MLELVSLRARADLRAQIFAAPFEESWPAFMMHDETAELYFGDRNFESYLDTVFVLIDPAQPDIAIGRAFAVSFAFGQHGRDQLPDTGWDGVIRWAHEDCALGRAANVLSALEITLLPAFRGQGASSFVLGAMFDYARALGYRDLFVPVRPNAKHLEPLTPMADYARRIRADGLPTDPWLRVHIRAGGKIVKVAPVSMVISGTIADWVAWTGTTFEISGQHQVAGALVPIHISLEQDHGVYVEPNIWVHHALRTLP